MKEKDEQNLGVRQSFYCLKVKKSRNILVLTGWWVGVRPKRNYFFIFFRPFPYMETIELQPIHSQLGMTN